MGSNLTQGPIQILGNSIVEINDALRQVQIRIDAMSGLSGRAQIHDRVGVSDPIDASDAVTKQVVPDLSGDNTLTGDWRFNGKLGHQHAPVNPQNVEALTNNVTSGGSSAVIANFTDLSTYATDAAAIRNDIYQLARSLQQVINAFRAYGFGI